MNSTINRGNAARALLEHGGQAPWWFDLWGESGEYQNGNLLERIIDLTGNDIRLSGGVKIYRRDLTGLTADDGPVRFTITGGSGGADMVASFELELELGDSVPEITWPDNVSWEDFGYPFHLMAGMTQMFYFRSTDGGKTWVGAMGPFWQKKEGRGGLVQKLKRVEGGNVGLEDNVSIYKSEPTGATAYTFDTSALTRSGVISFELHIKTRAAVPEITWPDNVAWEDFGYPFHIQEDKTTVFHFRTTDGGDHWSGAMGVFY